MLDYYAYLCLHGARKENNWWNCTNKFITECCKLELYELEFDHLTCETNLRCKLRHLIKQIYAFVFLTMKKKMFEMPNIIDIF